jgi:hypothetical protein
MSRNKDSIRVVLEFLTQGPQVALDSRLVITLASGQVLEVTSGGAFSMPYAPSSIERARGPRCRSRAAVLRSAA